MISFASEVMDNNLELILSESLYLKNFRDDVLFGFMKLCNIREALLHFGANVSSFKILVDYNK